MSISALSSPSLGSTSLLEWPAGLTTPDTGAAPRLVQKQVVRIKGMQSQASVALYLRMAISPSTNTQTLQLFPDEGIILKSSQVYPLQLSKEGKAVIPQDANRHLQRAAEVLGISRGIVSFSLSNNGKETTEAVRNRKAKITTSNFHVSLVIPPDADRPVSERGEDRSHYIAVIQLMIPFIHTPPKWPYMVRIPLPRCLNNYLNFTIDESCVPDNAIVEVDPPLLPKPSSMLGAKSKAKHDIELAEASGEADKDQMLSGPFYSTPSLCIRWASADAGKDNNNREDLESNHRLVQAEVLQVTAVYSKFRKSNNTTAEVLIEAQLTLKGVHYPGLDSTANVKLQLEASSGSCWEPETVSLIPSRQSSTSFRSFSTSNPTKVPIYTIKPGSVNHSRVSQVRSPSPVSSSSQISEELLDVDATLDDEKNLIDIRPPKGMASSKLDSSSDGEDEIDVTSVSKFGTSRKRRHSLGRRLPIEESNMLTFSKHDTQQSSKQTIYIVLSTAALCQGEDDFRCSLEATIRLPIHPGREKGDGMRLTLPVIKASGIALNQETTVQGAFIPESYIAKDVEWNRVGSKRSTILPSSPSTAEMHDARIDVEVTGAQKTCHDMSEESDDAFIKNNTQNKAGQAQAAQVDSLSGTIQEASVEVYSSLRLQEDLLLAEGVQRRFKTIHVFKSSWPSAPALSASTEEGCGPLLPQMVFAFPCSDDCELQILCASINGRSVQVQENSSAQSNSSSSRIVILQLPISQREAAKVDVFLLYMQESSQYQSLCLFPLVASSIADLHVTLDYRAFDSQAPTLCFSNQPVSVCDSFVHDNLHERKVRANMVPSMTSVYASFIVNPKSVLLSLETNDAGPPLRRKVTGKITTRFPFLSSTLLHSICTAILAIVIMGIFLNLEPSVDSLSRKVDSLAMALNVDFSEGSWKPEPVTSSSQMAPLNPTPLIPLEINPAYANVKESTDEPLELHELSIDTMTSFALLMRSIFTKTLSWPRQLLSTIFGHSSRPS